MLVFCSALVSMLAPAAPYRTNCDQSLTKLVLTDHFGPVLFVPGGLHLHEHVLDAVNVGAVLPAPPVGAGQESGFGGRAGASVSGIVEMVRGFLQRRQPRLVGVAVGGRTPQSGTVTASGGGPVPPAGRRGLGLHHVRRIRCLQEKAAASRSGPTFTCKVKERENVRRKPSELLSHVWKHPHRPP